MPEDLLIGSLGSLLGRAGAGTSKEEERTSIELDRRGSELGGQVAVLKSQHQAIMLML